nr:agenet-like domain, agenet domain [Tanacetum cinerariifolium]
MDPNTSIKQLCLGVYDHVSLNDGFESEGQWEGPEYQDIAGSGKKKETKSFTFYRMETEEIIERYITICFFDGLNAYDGEINREHEKNMISNEFIVKPCLDYEEKEGEKVVKKELLVALREAKFNFHAIADTGSNINVMPYRIYEKLGREKVKTVSHGITMLDHSKAELMGILKDVLCQVGVTTILAKFLILYVPIDYDVPIVIGRSFLYTCGSILNTIKGTTSTSDGVCHQKFSVAKVRNNNGESNSNNEEDYCLKRDEMGKPFYEPNHAKYLSFDDPMYRSLALQEALNHFKKIYVWKKAIPFLGSLPVPLQHAEWIPNHFGNFAKEAADGKWHAKIRVVDPYGKGFEQGYEKKATDRKIS